MSLRVIPALLAMSLVAVSCTSDSAAESTTTSGVGSHSRLVVLDDTGNIVTLKADGTDRVDITDDGDSVRYFQPVWSPADSTIAWGEAGPNGPALGLAAGDGTNVRKVELPEFPFYFNWSPDGKRIGLLHNGEVEAIDFEIVDVTNLLTSVIDSGSPYYFSWSPEGDAVVVHADGDRLAIFDESANPTDVGTPLREFLSPGWTKAGIFFLGPRGVVLRPDRGDNQLLAEVSGFVNINPNQDGSLVAIHTVGGSRGLTVGLTTQEILPADSVTIVDTETGESFLASEEFSLGSFWSPDGEKLVMLLIGSGEGEVDIVLYQDGLTQPIGTFVIPGSLVTEALQYFDQYAQSWQVWSPGSDAFVFPGTIGDDSGIWVYGLSDEPPARVGDGEWAAWSHG